MSASAFAQLVTAASDTHSDTERLVRGALLVARAAGDAGTSEWAARELGGYDGVDVPEYRQAPAMLKATDSYGRHLPVHLQDESAREKAARCPLLPPLADVIRFAEAPAGDAFQVSFRPEFERRLLQVLPGATSVFRVVQPGAFAAAVAAVRQKVFEWALEHVHENPELPAGIDLPAVLGLSGIGGTVTAQPVEARGGLDMSNARFTGPVQIVNNSPGTSAEQTSAGGPDPEVLKALVQALAGAASAATSTDGSGAELERAVSELRDLAEMSKPRAGWVQESLKSLRTVVEGATGALVSELAKPHVQVLLAQVAARWGT